MKQYKLSVNHIPAAAGYLLLLFMLLIASSCKKGDDISAEKALVINEGGRNLDPDESFTFTASFVAVDGTVSAAQNVSWSSSDQAVVSVSGGALSIQSTGSVTITATVTEDGQTYTASVPVAISAPSILAVVPSAIIWEVGGSMQLETVYLGTANPTYTFSSNDANVASVDANGLVRFNGVGSCVISVTASTHPGQPFLVPVLVVGEPEVTLPVTRVTVTPPTTDLFRGETAQLSAEAYDPNGAVSANFTWTSSDPSVVSVDANGNVTAKGLGNAYIMATAQGVTGQAEVYVWPDTIIEVTPLIGSIPAGGSKQFTAKAYNARNGMSLISGLTNFNWEIPTYGFPMFDFATVNSSGLVNVNGNALPGNMTFVVASLASNPEIAGVGVVMVSICDCGDGNPDVASIQVSNPNISLSLTGNPQGQLNATAYNSGGGAVANPELRYCSDDMMVAFVDELTGEVSAAGPGTTTISVCSGAYAEATATVNVSF